MDQNKSYYSFNIGICPFDSYSKINNENKTYGTKIDDDIYLNYSHDATKSSNKLFQEVNSIITLTLSYYPNDISQEEIDEDNYNIHCDKGTLNLQHINFKILPNWFPENILTKKFKIVVRMYNSVWYSKNGEYQLDYNPYGNYAVFEISNYDYDINNKMKYIEISKINFYDFSNKKIKEIKENNLTKYEEIFPN